MFSKVLSGAIVGVDGYAIHVEVDVSQGLPVFDIVGLPDSAVKESKERVKTAIKNAGYTFPIKRITVNLAPANIRKEGPSFDLPIAVGILQAMDIIPAEALESTFFTGELSLDGAIRPVSGILPMVYSLSKEGIRKFIVPFENRNEAGLVSDVEVVGISGLNQLVSHLTKKVIVEPSNVDVSSLFSEEENYCALDFSDVKGQENVKRALEISAAGAHNVIMIGPPGSGKTMMAKRFPTIMTNLTLEESMEVTKIYSVSGNLKEKNALITKRPFRSPHHTSSSTSLIGGGRIPKPGEISLSHNGVLFLDEMPEFYKKALEVMRQPMEDKIVTIARANSTITYPSNFMLLASMNPCPCGYYGNSNKCTCTQSEISKYINKISGPLLDRIDIQVEASSVKYSDLEMNVKSSTSSEIKKRVIRAQHIQKERYKNENIRFNSELTSGLLEKYCELGADERNILKQAFDTLGLSARAYHKICKVARTIADLENCEKLNSMHLAEAIQYRNLDRKYWNN